jgi:Spy/CpxP family protein refolding chaperone
MARYRNMKLPIVYGLITALCCFGPAAGAAEADPFDGRLLPLELVMAHRKEIGLTAGQNKQIGALVVDMQKAVADKQWRMQSAYFDLMAVLDEPQVDETRALELARQAVDTENEIKLEQMRLLIRVRNVLTAEQIATLRSKARRSKASG